MKDLEYRVSDAKWSMKDGVGNHRILVSAPKGTYVHVVLPWRRCDEGAKNVALRIFYTPDDKVPVGPIGSCEVKNILIINQDRFAGEIVFEAPEKGVYEVYYLPYTQYTPGKWWTTVFTYMGQDKMEADPAWSYGYEAALAQGTVADGEAFAYESRTAFDSFYPMEIPMSPEEEADFLRAHGERIPFAVVTESRLRPIHMDHDLPVIWRDRTIEDRRKLYDTAAGNEHYAFQLVVCAEETIEDVHVQFLDDQGQEYPLEKCICFNLNGRDMYGKEMEIHRNIEAGDVLSMWCGVRCELFEEKEVSITARVTAANTAHEETLHITLERTEEVLERNGDDDLWRMARLFWLNSDIGISNEYLKPYIPVEYDKDQRTIEILGRKIKLGEMGLPSEIDSYYDDECQLPKNAEPISLLNSPIRFVIKKDGKTLDSLKEVSCEYVPDGTMQGSVKSCCQQDEMLVESDVTYEYDGHIDCQIRVTPQVDGNYAFRLTIPYKKSTVSYLAGFGHEGGFLPKQWDLEWNEKRGTAKVWVGGTRAGLQLTLQPEEECFWVFQNPMPKTWYNNGRGGARISTDDENGRVMLEAWSGDMECKKNTSMVFHFHMIVTPFHPINYKRHWTERYYHPDGWKEDNRIPSLEKAKEARANFIIMHQGGTLNENINYPFIHAAEIKEQVDKAHAQGMRYKIYYTCRELSNYCTELWALRSLGDEIFKVNEKTLIADYFANEDEKHGIKSCIGGPWLVEHLRERYSRAWHQVLKGDEYDCAIGTNWNSRWMNYYLEGLNWMTRVVGTDGLYLDGISYDRHIMRRARRIMDAAKDGCRIDIHCGNDHMSERFGYGTPICTYMEHFASADSLWIGEQYRYEEQDAAFYLTEVSGIPLGLMGEMLHAGGNPWRGMLYGMSARAAWQQGGLSTPLWKFWDDFGMKDTKMLGYWNPKCPVSTENDQAKATVYIRKDGEILVSFATWYPADRKYLVSVNKEFLGITGDYEFFAPAIEGFQEETVFTSKELIPIKAGQGWLFVLRKK